VVAVLVTLLVYWIAEQYAELLGEHAEHGHLPTWPHIRAGLAASWPMVAASFVPLLVLVASRLAGASTAAAANAGLIAAETPVIEVVDQRLMLEGLRLIHDMNV